MNIPFFGGANEVGASSTLIEIEESRILVDVGIRMGPGQSSSLPDLPDFNKVGLPDAVLLTHAHTDHTGALPVLENTLPADVKVYCTPATQEITRILLEDSARRMEREKQEDRPPQYTPDDVTAALKRMELVSWWEPVQISDNVTATWIPAGHILGAAMIYIEGRRESILLTGDVSATQQLTIPSMVVPTGCKPDVMVMESTYGDRLHEVGRRQEEKRLAADVAKVVDAGGKVLIPAFAVGRSQEVILILKDAMERKEIREFPVYVDGMVQKVNDVYSRFSGELQQELQDKTERGENIFYSQVIKPVESDADRDCVASWDRCCIVGSSGMLIGGRSSGYAKHLATNPKNLIAITGYQAKGTPGRALEDLAKVGYPTDQEWFLDTETSVSVKCQVERYSLSAHADRNELMELVEKVQPRKLFLVHGDAEARGELFKSVCKKFPAIDVKLPENGKVYSVTRRTGISGGRRCTSDRILSEVFTFVQEHGLKGPFRVRELAEMWFGTELTTCTAVEFFKWCLLLESRFFERRSGGLFHLRPSM